MLTILYLCVWERMRLDTLTTIEYMYFVSVLYGEGEGRGVYLDQAGKEFFFSGLKVGGPRK